MYHVNWHHCLLIPTSFLSNMLLVIGTKSDMCRSLDRTIAKRANWSLEYTVAISIVPIIYQCTSHCFSLLVLAIVVLKIYLTEWTFM
jgi:hypothetical protein